MNCLILGAGLMQKPAILSAKELGFKTCVVDADEKAVCVPLADEFRKIDLKNKEGILEYAVTLKENGGLAAVFTAGTDFSMSVSYVCEKLNLPAHSFDAARNASIKTVMRQCFADNSVPSPAFLCVQENQINDKLIDSVLQKMDFPFVVKPVDNMGARGCRMVRSEKEFLPAIKAAVSASRTNNAIVEEYMEGPEYSIDAVVYNGTFTVTGFALRHIKYPPYFIEVGHTMPAILDKTCHDQLISVFALAAKALGLSCGVAKADIKYTKKGPMIGEIAGRLSGGYMSGWTYPYSSDLNLTKQAIKVAAGLVPSELEEKRTPVDYAYPGKAPYDLFEVPSLRTSAERAWISIPGTVEYIENIVEFTDKAVFDTLPRATVNLGSKVDFPRNNVEKCGNIISVSHNHQIAIEASEDAVSNIFITLKPNTPETDAFLNYSEQSDEASFPPDAFARLSEEELSRIEGQIPADKKVSEYLPEVLKSSEYKEIKDWNYNTIAKTVEKFDILRAKHPALDAKKFWKALMRGGIQAAVYFSDSN